MGFRVLVVGGTGQVGSGLVRALLAAGSCTEVVMVSRRTIPLAADARLRQVIMDTSAANFVGEFLHGQDGTTILENAAMKQRSQSH